MGLIRLLLIALILYFFLRLIKRLLQPAEKNPNIKGNSRPDRVRKKNLDIEDADYEEIE